MGILYIIGTPIGNLKDISMRALEVLRSVAVIFAEDTRVTKKLLTHYSIHVSIKRCDEEVSMRAAKEIEQCLVKQSSVALVTDAGTPGIADPGARVIAAVRNALPGVVIVPIPGPSALTTALSVSGFSVNQFSFVGYPPVKKGRKSFFASLSHMVTRPLIVFESPHRIQKTFTNLAEVFGNSKTIVVCRELTKIHEEIVSVTVGDAKTQFIEKRGRGEFVIIIP